MSNKTIIKVEGLSKKYILNKLAAQKSDLLVKNVLSSLRGLSQKKQTEEFYALKDVSFEIEQGDRVGIIGRNGAGKSTLLKILSRITPPTSGRIEYSGRMASLLEVGTGFHPDLSGRENIYLNGSILGMPKHEIDRKFDEIVAFAEVEKFLDTPVKRYSSGMYVRLAFAVAAHLDSDILIVDEVLAVGDAAFQKKCLGKMEDASQQSGKTILFVSHNMGQISSLCNKGILLNKGVVENRGSAKDMVNQYFSNTTENNEANIVFEYSEHQDYFIKKIQLLNSKNENIITFPHDDVVVIAIEIGCNTMLNDALLSFMVSDFNEKKLFTTQKPLSNFIKSNELKTIRITIPKDTLTPNMYKLSVAIHIPNVQLIDEKKNVASFTIYDNGSEYFMYKDVDFGSFFVNCKWE